MFVEADLVLFAFGKRADHDPGQRAFALKTDKEILKNDHRADQAARPVRHDIAPVLTRRVTERSLDDAEIDGIVRIRADQKRIAMIGNVIGDAGFTRHQKTGCSRRFRSIDQPDLRGIGVIMRVYNDKTAALRLADTEKKSRIGLLVDKHILRCRRSDTVTHRFGRPVVVIKDSIEQRPPVRRPGHIAQRIRQDIRQALLGLKIPDRDLAIFRPVPVDRCGEQAMIGRMGRAPYGKEGRTLGLAVAIQQNLFMRAVCIRDRPPAQNRILAAGHETAIIGPVAVR